MRYTIEEQRSTFQIYGMLLGTITLPGVGHWLFDFPVDGEVTRRMIWYSMNIGTWDGWDFLICSFVGAFVGYQVGGWVYKHLAKFFRG